MMVMVNNNVVHVTHPFWAAICALDAEPPIASSCELVLTNHLPVFLIHHELISMYSKSMCALITVCGVPGSIRWHLVGQMNYHLPIHHTRGYHGNIVKCLTLDMNIVLMDGLCLKFFKIFNLSF